MKILAPTNCPSCDFQLTLSSTGVDLVCPDSSHCPAQVIGRLSYFCQRGLGNITGLSEKQIQKFYEIYGVSDVADLFDLPWERIAELEGFGEKSVTNLQESIERSRNISDYKFLAGLGIEGIGIEVSRLVCDLIATKGEFAKN